MWRSPSSTNACIRSTSWSTLPAIQKKHSYPMTMTMASHWHPGCGVSTCQIPGGSHWHLPILCYQRGHKSDGHWFVQPPKLQNEPSQNWDPDWNSLSFHKLLGSLGRSLNLLTALELTLQSNHPKSYSTSASVFVRRSVKGITPSWRASHHRKIDSLLWILNFIVARPKTG